MNEMENLDPGILIMLCGLSLLHCMFAAKALNSKALISQKKKRLWSIISLLLGPIGYYCFQNRIPCEHLYAPHGG
jgi:hypothetical protein